MSEQLIEESIVDEKGIANLKLDIQTYSENIKKSLGVIQDLIGSTEDFYLGDSRSSFVDKTEVLMQSQNNIVNNGLSYVDDYNSVVSKFKDNDSKVTFSQNF